MFFWLICSTAKPARGSQAMWPPPSQRDAVRGCAADDQQEQGAAMPSAGTDVLRLRDSRVHPRSKRQAGKRSCRAQGGSPPDSPVLGVSTARRILSRRQLEHCRRPLRPIATDPSYLPNRYSPDPPHAIPPTRLEAHPTMPRPTSPSNARGILPRQHRPCQAPPSRAGWGRARGGGGTQGFALRGFAGAACGGSCG